MYVGLIFGKYAVHISDGPPAVLAKCGGFLISST
jgi:hypothetical protein